MLLGLRVCFQPSIQVACPLRSTSPIGPTSQRTLERILPLSLIEAASSLHRRGESVRARGSLSPRKGNLRSIPSGRICGAQSCIDPSCHLTRDSRAARYNNTMRSPAVALPTFVLAAAAAVLPLASGEDLMLAGGGYTAKTNPTAEANLALDASDIKESDDLDEKMKIYSDGQNTDMSLANLSLKAPETMAGDELYSIYTHAFNYIGTEKEHEDFDHFDEKDTGVYANTIVNDLFDLDEENIETDAALVTNVWMTVVHHLEESLRQCRTGKSGEADLDKAAAYWIGAGQEFGENEGGHMLYSLTEKAGARFGQDNMETEVNTNIIAYMNEIKADIFETGTCKDADGWLQMRFIVNKIVGQMNVPLVQNLYHYSKEKNEKFLELYALALVPQTAACDPSAFDWFLEELVLTDLRSQDFNSVVSRLQSLYPCLGIKCKDVGSYRNGQIPECSDANDVDIMAGFVPERDVSETAKLDRDILRIRILSERKAYDAALDVFKYGHNSRMDGGYNSMQNVISEMASDTANTPEFNLFNSYYGSPNFVEDMIMAALDTTSQEFKGASSEQRSEIASTALQTIVIPIYALEQFYDAVTLCKTETRAAEDAWDRGAALYIGSIEGADPGGTNAGVSLYTLANLMCGKFGTCTDGSDNDVSRINTQMIDFFQRGKESLSDGSCAALPDPTLPPALVADVKTILIQGTLYLAAVNDELSAGSDQGSVGAGHAMSRSILPYLNDVDSGAADSVDSNMAFTTGNPIPDGVEKVFTSVANTIQEMGVKCGDVGVYSGITSGDICTLGGSPSAPGPTNRPPPSTPSTPISPVAAPTLPPLEESGGSVSYSFTTAGKDFGKISLDVKEMGDSSPDEAKTIYNNGIYADSSLSQLSSDALSKYADNRLYNIFRYAFKDEPVFIEGGTGILADSEYTNTIVAKALDVADDTQLASHASIIMSTWMETNHHLSQAVESCSDSSIDGALEIDTAAAYYIGEGQVKGDGNTGNLMYSLAEESAALYGQDDGEAPVNTVIIQLLNDAKDEVQKCSSSNDPIQLRLTVDKIVSYMNVPLIRNLVFYMNAADDRSSSLENFIELYALSTIPQIAGCNPGAFAYLRDELIDYEWDSNDLKDILKHLKDNLSCFGLSCADIGALRDPVAKQQLCGAGESSPPLAGYTPTTKVENIAAIDRDILQMQILLQMGLPQLAKRIYTRGQNSVHVEGDKYVYQTLQGLATDDERKDVPQFGSFKSYFRNDYYADSAIVDALDKKGVFSRATDGQIAMFVTAALPSEVTYMYGLQRLYSAISTCRVEPDRVEIPAWDEGAAMLIGSIDSRNQISAYASGGTMMYALGNNMCHKFSTCDDDDRGLSSSRVVEYLTGGKLFLQEGECDSALDLIDIGIVASLQTSLIQGTLQAAAEMAASSSSDDVMGIGYAMMRAIIPVVNEISVTSASTISSKMKFDASRNPMSAGADSVFDAFMQVISDMDTDCGDVGTHRSAPIRDVCPSGAVKVNTSVSLSNGLYTTSTYVQDRSLIALDLRDMAKALQNGNTEVAKGIYEGGLNSDIYDKSGKKVGSRSLESFSTSASLIMAQEPTFIMFMYALGEIDLGRYLGGPVGEYADSIVQRAFDSNDPTLAVEAARDLNLWMYAVHELYQGVENCRRRVLKDDDGVHSIDEVAAYYIGDSQETGSSDRGHSLYAAAEEIGELFGQDSSGQTTVNTKIMSLLNDAKTEISYPGACTVNGDTYKRLRTIAHKVISQMTVPLVQRLIYNLAQNDRERVKIYSEAVVPLIAACDVSRFEFLRDKLLIEQYNVVDIEDIIKSLERSYQCLGITCSDVGTFDDYGTDCVGTPELNPLAGYTPQTDVRKFASLDLDIRSINIFMQEKAYGAVKDYYSLGRYASVETSQGEEVFSLKDLATTTSRQIVPAYEYFERHFEGELDEDASDYSDHIIERTLGTGTTWTGATAEQKTEIVVKTMQYMVVYMASLENMYEAIDDCESNDAQRNANSANLWDRAAALMIGSLEGTEGGGSDHGLMMYSLANKRCEQFQRCEPSTGKAELNTQLINLLYSGRGETMVNNCEALKKSTQEIEALLQVPLIQGTLRYALANEKRGANKSKGLAEGFVFSRSILPYVEEANGKAGRVIQTNMDFVNDPVPDGARAVFRAFAEAIPNMSNVDCEKVGVVDGIGGVCDNNSSSSARQRVAVTSFVVSFTAVIVGLAVFV